jgi:chemotaxis protein MotB
VVRAIGPLPNKVSVRGHTDASPFTNDTEGNWGLSTRRAEASLRTLIEGGLDRRQIKHVMGMAETEPLVPENPLDPRNRRITILLLREHPMPAASKG